MSRSMSPACFVKLSSIVCGVGWTRMLRMRGPIMGRARPFGTEGGLSFQSRSSKAMEHSLKSKLTSANW